MTEDELKENHLAVYDFNQRHPCCVICGCPIPLRFMPHHWDTRGAGGKDTDKNMDRACMKHHQQFHMWGIKKSAIEYSLVKPRAVLIEQGKWTAFDETAYQKRLKENTVALPITVFRLRGHNVQD